MKTLNDIDITSGAHHVRANATATGWMRDRIEAGTADAYDILAYGDVEAVLLVLSAAVLLAW